jgi:cell division protease FtsH
MTCMARQPRKIAPEEPADGSQRRPPDLTIWLILFAILGAWAVNLFLSQSDPVRTVPYSQFEAWLTDGKVSEVTVRLDSIDGVLSKPAADEPRRFTTIRVDPELAAKLREKNVTVSGARSDSWVGTLAGWVLPLLLFYLISSFMFRRLGDGGGLGSYLSIGKSRAKLYVETKTAVTFDDVAGVDEAKRELAEVVAFLKDPAAFGRLGARAPRGILLTGPPGTGKTLLARAVAGEAGVPFFSISGSEFVEMFVGVGAARVRDLFEQARKAAPSIIFIDELDALGRSRSGAAIGGYDEKEQTLNQLLSEIDGFDPSAGVILLAATNRPEILDKALLRAGRFDRQVLVDKPDRLGRLDILKVHVRKIRLANDLDLEAIAGLTTGFAGADLANLVNEAAIAATRREGDAVTFADFETAIERIVAGLEKRSRVMRPEERRRVAYHEMGHALVAAALPTTDPVQKVSIVPRGIGALGYTMQRPTEDRYLLPRSEFEERLAVLMGGRAAEVLIYDGDVSNGASDDLEHATQIALDMVVRYGMDTTVGERTFNMRADPFFYGGAINLDASEETRREMDLAVRAIIAAAADRALAILKARRDDLDSGVELLLVRETLSPADFAPLKKQTARPKAA